MAPSACRRRTRTRSNPSRAMTSRTISSTRARSDACCEELSHRGSEERAMPGKKRPQGQGTGGGKSDAPPDRNVNPHAPDGERGEGNPRRPDPDRGREVLRRMATPQPGAPDK